MASYKLSDLTALTSVGSDDLVYVADTADGGSTYASKKVTKANLFSGYALESYVDTAIANTIDGAPGALDTLNELAAALGDDARFYHAHQPDQRQRDPHRQHGNADWC